MLSVCWSPKGGCGVSVVAAALALRAARAGSSTLLVDLGGDLAAILGVDAAGPGVAEWLASPDAPVEALSALAVEVVPDLALIPSGATAVAPAHDRLATLVDLCALQAERVVVDAGVVLGDPWWPRRARSIAVVRACYLAVRRLATVRPPTDHAVVLVEEPGRALTRRDVGAALGAPLVAVPWDPAVARAVDAGLLASRMPRSLRALGALEAEAGRR